MEVVYLPRVGELEVLVEVVESIKEVPELPAQQGQHVPVAVQGAELDEVVTHPLKKVSLVLSHPMS